MWYWPAFSDLQYQDALSFLSLLGSLVSASHSKKHHEEPEPHDDDSDDWGAPVPAAKPKDGARRKGCNGGTRDISTAYSRDFDFPSPDPRSEGTLVKLVAGATLNGLRCLVEAPADSLPKRSVIGSYCLSVYGHTSILT